MGFFEDFKNVIREGFRLAFNIASFAVEKALELIRAYFRQVRKWSIRLAIAAAVPLVVIIPFLLFGVAWGWLYGTYVVYLVLLLAAELVLLTPMVIVWKRAKVKFPGIALDLEEWIGFIKTVVFTGLSFGIFVTLFPVWRSPGTFPLLLLVLACWLTLPACAFSNFCRKMYPAVRAVQLLLLGALLVLQMAFPRQLSQMKWLMSRTAGNALSVRQKEVTTEWRSLTWFNNAGEPQVWFSGSSGTGYRLWAAPGFDPASGKELRPVADEVLRMKLMADFTERDRIQREKQTTAQVAASRNAEDQRQRQLVQQKEEYVARYIAQDQLLNTPAAQEVAVLVVTDKRRPNDALGRALAAALKAKSAKASTSFFTPQFISDGLFDKTFSGAQGSLNKLELPHFADCILLGRETVNYSTNESLQGLVTASMKLELSAVSSLTQQQFEARTLTASGAGFKDTDALLLAEERLIKQISSTELDSFFNAVSGRSQ